MIKSIETYFDRLWPICRSITGDGLRESLKILQNIIPLDLHEIPTGVKVFDWEIPLEWNINDAYIIDPKGNKIADFKKNNLHIVNYSEPINKQMTYLDLKEHIFTLPRNPTAIPYVTSYYNKNWGFCISHNEFLELPKNGIYKVYIDSCLKKGNLTYGDYLLPGNSKKEILFSTYLCHPSLANNELSGPIVTSFLYRKILKLKNRHYSYRFVFVPETIGAIAYLDKNGDYLKQNLHAGYVVTCCGDNGNFTYKESKNPKNICDRMGQHILNYHSLDYKVVPFSIGGSDERQYCSPGFNLPVGSLMRSMYGTYAEYHNSLDNKSFIDFNKLKNTIEMYLKIVKGLELNKIYKNNIPYCEPYLNKRGLFPDFIKNNKSKEKVRDLLHFLSFCDGKNELIDIAEKRGKSILHFEDIVETCLNNSLIQ